MEMDEGALARVQEHNLTWIRDGALLQWTLDNLLAGRQIPNAGAWCRSRGVAAGGDHVMQAAYATRPIASVRQPDMVTNIAPSAIGPVARL